MFGRGKKKAKKPTPAPKPPGNEEKKKDSFDLFVEKKKEEQKDHHEVKEEKKQPEEKEEKHEEKPKKKHGFSLFGRKKKDKKQPDKKEEHDKKKDKKEKHKKKKAKKKHAFPVRVNPIPKFYENWVTNQLWFSGSEKSPKKVIATMFIISLMISGAVGAFFGAYMIYLTGAAFIIIFGVFNALLALSVDRRGRFVDEILPDALLLLSANIRAGYIPSRALILSARKEFGPLSDAIRRAGKEIMTGASLEEGMKEIPKRIKSKDLGRTVKLIIEGIRGGGQIVTLLEENAVDIRRRQGIRKEISANIMMYAIFIAFAGCIGAPGLYALSGYLTSTMAELSPDVSMSDQISSKVSFISLSGVSVSPEFLFQFSIAAILITTVFGGLILGLINSGKEKDGLKYAPILSIIAILVFFGASFVVNTMFSSIIPT